MQLIGSEIILKTLLERGTTTIFGYPGGSVIPFFDTLYDYEDRFKIIRPSHEQGGSFAADGYARTTGKPGVLVVTSGPGATNTVTGIANAYMDSIPMIVITGQVGRGFIGRDSFQEIDITSMTMPITKHNFLVKNADELQEVVNRAYTIATSGRPGPVLIDVPKDVFTELGNYNEDYNLKDREVPHPSMEKVAEVVELLKTSKKPLIYCGGGVVSSNSYLKLRELVHRLNIPVVPSLMAKGVLKSTDKFNLGHVGMHGFTHSNYAMSNCDLLLAIGTRFSDRVTSKVSSFAHSAKIVQVDIDNSEIGKNKSVDLSIHSDAGLFLDALLEKVTEEKNKEWIEEVLSKKTDLSGDGFNPKKIIESIGNSYDEDTIVVTDVGQHQMWVSQYYPFKKPRTFCTSAGVGAMGYGLGGAIGAAVANSNKKVILITGDGSFRMNLNELATVRKYNLNIQVFVLDNSTLGMVRQWQNMFQNKKFSQTDVEDSVDYLKLAGAFYMDGYRVNSLEELDALLTEDFKNSPSVVQIPIDKDEFVLPIIPAGASYDDMILN